jgi:hypothetical protein
MEPADQLVSDIAYIRFDFACIGFDFAHVRLDFARQASFCSCPAFLASVELDFACILLDFTHIGLKGLKVCKNEPIPEPEG